MPPTWTILIPTIGERRALFARLTSLLLPQTEPYAGRVRVLGWHNNGHPSLPVIRQRMAQTADSDYVSCIDDDDLVPAYFVDEVMSALGVQPDYVGFLVQCYSDGVPTAISHHSLTNQGWRNDKDRYYRDFSHINPIKRTWSLQADFSRARPGAAEDRVWVEQMRRTAKYRRPNEVMINRVMYHYLFSTSRTAGIGSRWQAPKTIAPGMVRWEIDHPNFSWHPESE